MTTDNDNTSNKMEPQIAKQTINYCEITVSPDTLPRSKRKCIHIGITHCQKYGTEHIEDNTGYIRCDKQCEIPFNKETN